MKSQYGYDDVEVKSSSASAEERGARQRVKKKVRDEKEDEKEELWSNQDSGELLVPSALAASGDKSTMPSGSQEKILRERVIDLIFENRPMKRDDIEKMLDRVVEQACVCGSSTSSSPSVSARGTGSPVRQSGVQPRSDGRSLTTKKQLHLLDLKSFTSGYVEPIDWSLVHYSGRDQSPWLAGAEYFLFYPAVKIICIKLLYRGTMLDEAMHAREDSPSRSGYLIKLGHLVKNWKTRWFVLYRDTLSYYVRPERKGKPQGEIHITDIERVSSSMEGFEIAVRSGRVYRLQTQGGEEAKGWISSLQEAREYWSVYHTFNP